MQIDHIKANKVARAEKSKDNNYLADNEDLILLYNRCSKYVPQLQGSDVYYTTKHSNRNDLHGLKCVTPKDYHPVWNISK